MVVGVGVYFVINTVLLVCVVEVSMGTTWREFTSDLAIQVRWPARGHWPA